MFALELVVPGAESADADAVESQLRAILTESGLPCRFSVALLAEGGNHIYRTLAPVESDAAATPSETQGGAVEVVPDLHDIHPEIAERIGMGRYSAFDLERLPSEEGIYCLYGRAREVKGDDSTAAKARHRWSCRHE